MEVILLEKIANLGGLGDQVIVKSGYGRNYLIPHGKAIPATTANMQKFETRRAGLEKAASEAYAAAEIRQQQMSTLIVRIPARAGEEGKLFGSVGVHDLAQAITATGHHVEKSEIRLPNGPLRQIGEFEIGIHLHTDITVNIKVEVVSE